MDATPEFARALLVSVHPRHALNILDGKKTVELRRRFPERHMRGAFALIYSTKPVQAIVGLARIKYVLKLPISRIWKEHGAAACVSKTEVETYFAGVRVGYAIFLDGVRPFKQKLTIDDLHTRFGIVPPQSYRYVNADCIALLSDERLQIPDRHKRSHWPRRRAARSDVSR
jgi:predicted transcriptional regulator